MTEEEQLRWIRCGVALASLTARSQDITARMKGLPPAVSWIGSYAFSWGWPTLWQGQPAGVSPARTLDSGAQTVGRSAARTLGQQENRQNAL